MAGVREEACEVGGGGVGLYGKYRGGGGLMRCEEEVSRGSGRTGAGRVSGGGAKYSFSGGVESPAKIT